MPTTATRSLRAAEARSTLLFSAVWTAASPLSQITIRTDSSASSAAKASA